MSVVDDVHARLTAALGPEVPVLRPEQMGDPIKGNKPGQDGGLPAYLRAHPLGYVQVYDLALGYTLSGWADNQLLQIDTIASTRTQAFSLAYLVRDELASTPRRGGNKDTVTPPFVSSAATGSVCVTQRFNVHTPYFKGSDL